MAGSITGAPQPEASTWCVPVFRLRPLRVDQVKIMRDTIPRAPGTLFSLVGPRACIRYADRLHPAHVPVLPAAA
jgi:hypothetical protein